MADSGLDRGVGHARENHWGMLMKNPPYQVGHPLENLSYLLGHGGEK